jgi:tetratricopeptide (TPR) repeat protein
VTGIFGRWQWGIRKQRNEITELRYEGLLRERAEQPQQALNYYQQALKISQKINDYKAQVSNFSDCGTMYMILNKPEQALDYFKQALNIREQLGDSEGVTFEKNNIVLAYGKLGKVEKPMELYKKITGEEGNGRGKPVGFISGFNCSSDAFELLSGGTIALHLYPGRPLYYADQMKVIKENCEIQILLQDKKQTLIRKDNSPYIVVEKASPSGFIGIFSEWVTQLMKVAHQRRTAASK